MAEYGKRPEDRTIEDALRLGVINLNKPQGPTSHQVSSWVKNIVGSEKAGHSGTLDPRVTGVLPIALDDAAKALEVVHLGTKEYVGILHFHSAVRDNDVREIFKEFNTTIFQTPPVRSAVKRQRRQRKIYNLGIIELDGQDVLFRVECESGTYIRTLCHDIGEAIGVGGHMKDLRRTRSANFHEKDSVDLNRLKDAHTFWKENGEEKELRKCILPVESLFSHLKNIIIKDSSVDAVCHGANLAVPGVVSWDKEANKGNPIAIYTQKEEIVALGQMLVDSDALKDMGKGFVVNVNRVFMSPGVYPSIWKKS